MNKSKNVQRIKNLSKLKKRTNPKRNKRIKKYKRFTAHRKLVFKSLLIIFLYIIIFIYYFTPKFYINLSEDENEKEPNYDWRKNSYNIINKQISILNGQANDELKFDVNFAKNYFNYRDYSKKGTSTYNNETKELLMRKLSERCHKDFSRIKSIVIMKTFFFGNQIAALNNLIYYCEILGIKNLYFNSKYDFYLKNNITTNNINISVISIDKFNCSSTEIFCGQLYDHFYFPIVVRPKRRSIILKDEIKRNLPQIEINKNDLYIYIRSGDSFSKNGNEYTPSPYCFYEKVITKFKFNDIYIISVDNKSPVIEKLLKNFPNIKHKLNPINLDIAMLVNAYNLANSVSSFTQAAISFNDNLENLFDYDIYKIVASILHFHYDIDKLNRKFNIYRMKPSENYFRKMYRWKNSEEQRKLLIEENCINELIKTRY